MSCCCTSEDCLLSRYDFFIIGGNIELVPNISGADDDDDDDDNKNGFTDDDGDEVGKGFSS